MIGFIGSGNMGKAIIDGIVSAVSAAEIMVSDIDKDSLAFMEKKYGVSIAENNIEAAKKADILFLCVKPNVLYSVIDEIKESVRDNTVIISIAAGQSIKSIEETFGKAIKLVRVMPNTPALVGEGMAALSVNENVSDAEAEQVKHIFDSLGKSEMVSESMMDAVTAVSGSSPAYVFMFIEAMADAAVQCGLPRNKAYTFAAQSVLGSAKMVLDTKLHPGTLKDMVCSPGGTTIDAVAVLEKHGFRGAVMDAVRACAEKSKELGRK